MQTMSCSEPEPLTLETVWTTLHPTVRQRLLEMLATLAVKRLTQERADPLDKEVLCQPPSHSSTLQ